MVFINPNFQEGTFEDVDSSEALQKPGSNRTWVEMARTFGPLGGHETNVGPMELRHRKMAQMSRVKRAGLAGTDGQRAAEQMHVGDAQRRSGVIVENGQAKSRRTNRNYSHAASTSDHMVQFRFHGQRSSRGR